MATQRKAVVGKKGKKSISSAKMAPQQGGKPMTFDQWLNQVSKAISLQSNEGQKDPSKIFELCEEDFEEEELSSLSQSKQR
jgi:hypothetical protein